MGDHETQCPMRIIIKHLGFIRRVFIYYPTVPLARLKLGPSEFTIGCSIKLHLLREKTLEHTCMGTDILDVIFFPSSVSSSIHTSSHLCPQKNKLYTISYNLTRFYHFVLLSLIINILKLRIINWLVVNYNYNNFYQLIYWELKMKIWHKWSAPIKLNTLSMFTVPFYSLLFSMM